MEIKRIMKSELLSNSGAAEINKEMSAQACKDK